jgi:hypothetical protein
MIGSEVDLIGEGELGRGNAKLVRLGALAEDLVAARVFHFKGQLAIGCRVARGAVHRQCADVDGLARLIDGLFCGEKDGGLVFELDGLRVFGGADGRVYDEAQLIAAGEAGGKTEARFDGAAAVEAAREEQTRFLIGNEKVDVQGSRLGDVAVGFRDDDADSGLASGNVLLLAEDVNDWAPDDLRDGLNAFNCGERATVILEAVTNSLPENILEGDGLRWSNGLLPRAAPFRDVDIALHAAQRTIFRVENLHRQFPGAFLR